MKNIVIRDLAKSVLFLLFKENLAKTWKYEIAKKVPLLAIQRVDLADVVVHGADHEAADRGEGHRVGEVRPVLRRLRVALAAMDLMMMAIMMRMVMIAMKMVMVTMVRFSDISVLHLLVRMRLLLVIVRIGR